MEKTIINSLNISEAMTRLENLRRVHAGQVIKVAFLSEAPNYATSSLDAYWEKYFPQVQKSSPGTGWHQYIEDEYNEATRIHDTFQPILGEMQQVLFNQAIKKWSDTYANVNFVLVSDPAQADVRVGLSDDDNINFAPGALADAGRAKLGDVYLNTSLKSNLSSTRTMSALFHEFGHVLGLSHPSSKEGDGPLPAEYGSQQYSVMSYGSVLQTFNPATPMLFDALGLQKIGTLKSNVNLGDTTYGFADESIGRLLIDNGGNNDTIDAGATTTANEIDLRSTDFESSVAYFSSIGVGSGNYNVAIYDGSKMENAIGGGGSDVIIGNDADNKIDGGKGNDQLQGGLGNDTYQFVGGFGKDKVQDQDGLGSIQIDGKTLGTAKAAGKANIWVADLEGQKIGLAAYNDSSSSTGKKLVITRAGSTADSITINNFDLTRAVGEAGYLGIHLDGTPKLALRDAGGPNPFEDTAFDPATLTGNATIAEHGGKSFTVYLNRPAQAGDMITLGLSALQEQFQVILGDSTIPAQGAVITLSGGQTQVAFALVQEGDVQASGAAQLSATYQGLAGQEGGQAAQATSNAWSVALQDLPEAATRTIRGDQHGYLINGVYASGVDEWGRLWLEDGTIANGVTEAGFADVLGGYNGQAVQRDRISGLGGNDALQGRFYEDYLDGGDGDDLIGGGPGADVIYGGDGSDVILSAAQLNVPLRQKPDDKPDIPAGAVVLQQGPTWARYRLNGATYILGGGTTDEVDSNHEWVPAGTGDMESAGDFADGGAGDDYIAGGLGADRFMGGSGNDEIWGNGNDDIIDGGDGDDRLNGDGVVAAGSYESTAPERHGADFIDGGLGNDSIVGGGGDDQLFGGAGDDRIFGDEDVVGSLDGAFHGSDFISGEDGNDLLIGNGGDDVLYGGEGNDEIQGDSSGVAGQFHGADFLDGGNGNDVLFGGGGADELIGGNGDDVLSGDDVEVDGQFHGADRLDGGDGNDVLFGDGGADELIGGSGNDQLEGDAVDVAGQFHGADYLDGGDGDDTLYGQGGDDVLLGGKGDDYLEGDDDQVPSQFHGNDLLDGGDGNDQMRGQGGNDTLLGGLGDDILDGDDGDDVLDGGEGSNILHGGAGNDSIIVGADDGAWGGEGDDTFWVNGPGQVIDTEGRNTYYIAASASDAGANGVLNVPRLEIGPQDTLVFEGLDVSQGLGTEGGIRLSFADFNGVQVPVLWGGATAVMLSNVGLADSIRVQGAGGEVVTVNLGDVAVASAVPQTVQTDQDGANVHTGGGDDLVQLDGAHSTASTGEGRDSITIHGTAATVDAGGGADRVWITAPDAVVTPGAGDDQLWVSAAHTTVVLHGRDGQGNPLVQGDDRLVLTGSAASVVLDVGEDVDLASVEPYFSLDESGQVGFVLKTGDPQAGTAQTMTVRMDVEDLEDLATPVDLAGRITLKRGDELVALSTVAGAGIKLVGSSGDDQLEGTAGNDTLLGGDGDDFLMGGDGADVIDGGAGTTITVDEAGADTYVIRTASHGGGLLQAEFYGDIERNNFLDFADAIEGDVSFVQDGDDLRVMVRGELVAQLQNVHSYDLPFAGARFSDGTQWDANMLAQRAYGGLAGSGAIHGTPGDDIMRTGDGDDVIYGEDGNDVIFSGAGNDILDGGPGDDALNAGDGDDELRGLSGSDVAMGGSGRDTYVVGAGATLYIRDSAQQVNVLRFSGVVNFSDIAVTRSGKNLVLAAPSLDGQKTSTFIIENFSDDQAGFEKWQIETGSESYTLLSILPPSIISPQKGSYEAYKADAERQLDEIYKNIENHQIILNEVKAHSENIASLDIGSGVNFSQSVIANRLVTEFRQEKHLVLERGTEDKVIPTTKEVLVRKYPILDPKAGIAGVDIPQGAYWRFEDPYTKNVTDSNGNIRQETHYKTLAVYRDEVSTKHVKAPKMISREVWDDVSYSYTQTVIGTDVAVRTWDIQGTSGDDVITVGDYARWSGVGRISGNDGDDTLIVRSGFDGSLALPVGMFLDGGIGDDLLIGALGSDVLVGDAGTDVLLGGGGSDTYIVDAGDVVADFSVGPRGEYDRVILPGSVKLSDLQVEISDWAPDGLGEASNASGMKAVRLSWSETEWVTIVLPATYLSDEKAGIAPRHLSYDFGNGRLIFDAASAIDYAHSQGTEIIEVEGVSLGLADFLHSLGVQDLRSWPGIQVDEAVYANNDDEIIYGDASDDVLIGGNGKDTLIGGDGNDLLIGDKIIIGGAMIIGGADVELVSGTMGGDGDVYKGGRGDDLGWLTAGADTIYFNMGDGIDTYQSWETYTDWKFYYGMNFYAPGGAPDPLPQNIGAEDTIVLGEGLHLSGMHIEKVPSSGLGVGDGNAWRKDLIVTFDGTDDRLIFTMGADLRLNFVESGTVPTPQPEEPNRAPVVAQPLPEAHLRASQAWAYTLVGDSFTDPDAGDVLTYSATLSDGSPLPEWLNFDAATRTFSGTPTSTAASAMNLTVTATDAGGLSASQPLALHIQPAPPPLPSPTHQGTSANDTLKGGAGDDILDGGAGNDTLKGGLGNNTYLFGRGDGQDRISSQYDTTEGKTNTLQLKQGITASDLTLRRDGANLIVGIVGTQDQVLVENFLYLDDSANIWNPVQQIRLEDGSVLTRQDIVYQLLQGSSADDTLRGTTGDDTIDGGAGNDTLSGGLGNNTYLFGRGDGQDRITFLYDTTTGKLNTLQFKPGVASADISLRREGANLVVAIAGTQDQVLAENFLYLDDSANVWNPLQQIRFDDGTTWGLQDIVNRLMQGTTGADNMKGTSGDDMMDGGAGNDILNGGAGNDQLIGGEGDDQLLGEAGDDALDGGAGNDTLSGGLGNNTYLFGRGDGQDRITFLYDTTTGKRNTLQFKPGVASADISLRREGANLVVAIADTQDQVLAENFLYLDDSANVWNPLQQIRFDDGTTWGLQDIVNRLMQGTTGADNMKGTSGDDVMDGGAGNDILNGGAGNDQLIGGEGDDKLLGEAGNDTLGGGAGSDTLSGGLGNNTYLFGQGDGQDRITFLYDTSADKLNTLQLKEGISTSDITLQRDGANLLVGITGTQDQMLVENFLYLNNSANVWNPVQQIRFDDGTTLSHQEIVNQLTLASRAQPVQQQAQQLVQAMAAFAPAGAMLTNGFGTTVEAAPTKPFLIGVDSR